MGKQHEVMDSSSNKDGEHQQQEGYYKIFENSKARVEIPGCCYVWAIKPAADGTTMVSILQGTSQIEWVMVAMSTWHLQR